MSIELNEYEWAERMIGNRDLGKKPVETLSRVARYYYENSYGKRDIRRRLDAFLLQCDPNASLVHWSDTLDRIVRGVGRYKLVRMKEVVIHEPELRRIETLEGKQLRRLAFTLLCVARYWDNVSEANNHWVNTQDKEIMKLANIATSIKRQSAMMGQLRKLGFIRFSKKIDNLNVRVLFMEDGPDAIHIQDFRNLGYQYLKYCGEPYFECVSCGVTEKIREPNRGRPPKYCPACAAQMRTRQNVNAVMRRRQISEEAAG